MTDTRDLEAARLFHDTYERLAPSFGYETRKETRQFDPESPNGKLMIAVCREVLAAALAEQRAEIGEWASKFTDANLTVMWQREEIERLTNECDVRYDDCARLREQLAEAQRRANAMRCPPREPVGRMRTAALEIWHDGPTGANEFCEALWQAMWDAGIAMHDAATGGKDG